MPPKVCNYCFYLYGQACREPVAICLLDKKPIEVPEEYTCQGWYPTRQYLEETVKKTDPLLQAEGEGK